ncbi:MAG: carbohydrate kinase family protein [Azospirillaceae bacterium]|nr:carbohydrate kinase family protein [Azospirillaceae bacterium]
MIVTRGGILCAGCWLVDNNKTITRWPEEETLTTVTACRVDGGGPAHNMAIDLARLGAAFPLWALGAIGDDEAGRQLSGWCRAHQIDTSHLRVTGAAGTAYTDVMTDQSTGRRTFFHFQGANALLSPDDFDFTDLPARIMHLGAPGIHQRMDAPCAGDANGWVTVLRRAQAAGLRTNLEMISSTPAEIRRLVQPCLAHLDSLIINDFEAGALTGLAVVRDGHCDARVAREAAAALIAAARADLVVIHFPEGCVAATRDGTVAVHPSLRVPPEVIQGANGAGDAFAAGVLWGVHQDWALDDSLVLGLCAAASALCSVSTTGSVAPVAECLALPARWGWRAAL